MAWLTNFTKEACLVAQSDNQINEALTILKNSKKGIACCTGNLLERTRIELERLGYRVVNYGNSKDYYFVYNYGENEE